MKIGFAGLSHLGLISAVASAARGFDIVGFDGDAARVQRIAAGDFDIEEPGLAALFAQNRAALHFSADPASFCGCDLVYISLDVPTDQAGVSDLAPTRELIAKVTPHLSDGALLVVLCQVPPGFTRSVGWDPARTYYQVETLVFGRAVHRAHDPERFIVGCPDPATPLPDALATYLGAFNCPILPMRLESAELTKISINLFLVASITTANTIAELCEHIGADWSEMIPALRLDARIGQHAYIQAGLGLSGGNLERDLTTMRSLAAREGSDDRLIRAFVDNSQYRRAWVGRTLHGLLDKAPRETRLGLLGIAYKQDTHSTKNAPSLDLIRLFDGADIAAYDPAVPADAVAVRRVSSALDACDGADAVAIMTPWSEFRAIAPHDIAQRMRGRLIVDPFGVLSCQAARDAGLSYVTLGTPARS